MPASIDIREHKEKIVIVLAIIIAFFVSKKIWGGYQGELSQLKENIKTQKESIVLAEDIKEIGAQSKKFNEFGWDTTESVAIMGMLNTFATKHNIQIYSFDPGPLQRADYYSTLSMSLNVSADYTNLLRFLTAIESMKTKTEIVTINLLPQGDQTQEESSVRAQLTIVAYIITTS